MHAKQALSSPTLRQFDSSDWDAFSGCDSDSPLVVEYSDPNFFLIVDDQHVEAHRVADDERSDYYVAHFPSAGIALVAAMSLVGNESLAEVANKWDSLVTEGSDYQGVL
tara:strand:- start:7431 stop:7757 length:327 start_codon:yes stop_codon:yes gene_type:complete